MTIDLLEEKTVVHNFLRVPYSTFKTLQSTVQMESIRSSSNNVHDFLLHRWSFRLNTINGSLRNDDWFTGAKDCCSQFFAGSAKYVSNAKVHSSHGIKPFFYKNNDHDFL